MKVLHLGAGRIGLGLVVPTLNAENEVVVLDRNREKVDAINYRGGYTIHKEWYGQRTEERVSGFSIQTYDKFQFIDDVDVVTTSVIVSNLPAVAPFIAKVIEKNARHLFIVPMENSFAAVDILKRELLQLGIGANRFTVLRSVLDRIVTDFNGLTTVVAEPYARIMIEQTDDFLEVCQNSTILSPEIAEEAEKKLLLVNGLHACAAYLGYQRGCKYISDVFENNELVEELHSAGECYIDYLVATLGCDKNSLERTVDQTLERFGNYSVRDPLERVGRNMMLKLAPHERIRRPLEYNRIHNLRYEALQKVVVAANQFVIGNDYKEYIAYSKR